MFILECYFFHKAHSLFTNIQSGKSQMYNIASIAETHKMSFKRALETSIKQCISRIVR